MKSISVLFGMVICSNVFASTPVDTKQYSCRDLGEMLRTQGTLDVKMPFNGHILHVARPDQCDSRQWANYAYVRSQDERMCLLGYVCQRRN